MVRRTSSVFLAVLLAGVPALAPAATPVQFDLSAKASEALSKVLLSSHGVSAISANGISDTQPFQAATCRANVVRPDRDDAQNPLVNSRNAVNCTLTYPSGAPALVLLDLSSSPVASWGHYGSSKAFTIEGDLARVLFRLLKAANEKTPDDPILDSMDFFGPNGHRVTSYGIKSAPDERLASGRIEYSVLAVDCVAMAVYERVHRVFCNFLHFD